MASTIQAVFIDRDGTIGGNGHFVHPRNFTLYPADNLLGAVEWILSNQ